MAVNVHVLLQVKLVKDKMTETDVDFFLDVRLQYTRSLLYVWVQLRFAAGHRRVTKF